MRNKIFSAAGLLLILAGVLSCGGSKSSGCGTTTNDVTVQYVWVTNESAQSLSSLQLSSAGILTSNGSATATGGQGPREIAFDPTNKFLFVLNHLSSSVSVLKVDQQTGVLTPVTGSPFTVGAQVTSMALHPSGKFLFVTDNVTGFYALSVDATSGALKQVTGSPFTTGVTQPKFVVVDPGGKYVYVANAVAPLVLTGYNVDTANETVTPMEAPFSLGANTPAGMMIDNSGKYFLIATAEGTLSYFDINATTGELTENAHSPLQIPSTDGVRMAMSGNYLYILDTNASWIDVYALQQDGSFLYPGSQQLSTSITPKGITVDRNNKYLMVTDSSGGAVAAYSIDSTTGGLTAVGSAVASGAGAGEMATGNLTQQVTTPVPCNGSIGGIWH